MASSLATSAAAEAACFICSAVPYPVTVTVPPMWHLRPSEHPAVNSAELQAYPACPMPTVSCALDVDISRAMTILFIFEIFEIFKLLL